jgi:hypothetical protein
MHLGQLMFVKDASNIQEEKQFSSHNIADFLLSRVTISQ